MRRIAFVRATAGSLNAMEGTLFLWPLLRTVSASNDPPFSAYSPQIPLLMTFVIRYFSNSNTPLHESERQKPAKASGYPP